MAASLNDQTPGMLFEGYQFHQLAQVPYYEAAPDNSPSRETAEGLLAALSGAHATLLQAGPRAAILTAWIKLPDERQVRFLAGGRPHFPPATFESAASNSDNTAARALLFPPGALATPRSSYEFTTMINAFGAWSTCTGTPDALWAAADVPPPSAVRRGSFDRQVANLRRPFVWLVTATPLSTQDLQPELDQLVADILPLAKGEVSQAKRVSLERKQFRHRELSRSREGGLWRVHVHVGSDTLTSATTTAALLCAASELDGLPYTLTPADVANSLHEAIGIAEAHSLGFTSSTRLLVALTRPPSRELPGLRLVQPHTFDVTPDHPDTSGLHLGAVLDETGTNVGDVTLSPETLNRHTFVCGATGTGKSQTVRHLLHQATRAHIPWLVIEPAKAEYSLMAARLDELDARVVVIRPSDSKVAPAGLNPLEPAPNFPLQTHADLLRALFLASFDAQEPFPQILAAALTRCYEELGWDLTLGTHATTAQPAPDQDGRPASSPRYPTLSDLQRVADVIVDEIGYGKEITDNVRGFIKVRLGSLRLGTTGRFFEGGHPIDFQKLYDRNVVLEIEDIGDDSDKAFLMGVVLIRLIEHLRTTRRHGGSGTLRHLTVIEEAHRLLRRQDNVTGAAAHAVEMFAALLAEIRAYGEGLIIAEQIPSKLIPDVIKNTAVKIMHRLPAADDRDTVGATMNLDEEQSKFVLTLPNGQAAVFADGMDRPILTRMPNGAPMERIRTERVEGPDVIIGRRSITCGDDCRTSACTLQEMQNSRHILSHSWFTAWAELSVVAHLVAVRMPIPTPDAIRTIMFTRTSVKTIHCAISHAVDQAVACRSAILQHPGNDETLTTHISEAMRAVLTGTYDSPCVDAWKYMSRPHQWFIVQQSLTQALGLDTVHPETSTWEERYQRPIPGSTVKEQLDVVKRWTDNALRQSATQQQVHFGTRRPSALEIAVGAASDDSAWIPRLKETLENFHSLTWALEIFKPRHD